MLARDDTSKDTDFRKPVGQGSCSVYPGRAYWNTKREGDGILSKLAALLGSRAERSDPFSGSERYPPTRSGPGRSRFVRPYGYEDDDPPDGSVDRRVLFLRAAVCVLSDAVLSSEEDGHRSLFRAAVSLTGFCHDRISREQAADAISEAAARPGAESAVRYAAGCLSVRQRRALGEAHADVLLAGVSCISIAAAAGVRDMCGWLALPDGFADGLLGCAADNPRLGRESDYSGEIREAYAVLGLPEGADRSDIASAYRALIRVWHPDVTRRSEREDAHERAAAINNAYSVLSGRA